MVVLYIIPTQDVSNDIEKLGSLLTKKFKRIDNFEILERTVFDERWKVQKNKELYDPRKILWQYDHLYSNLRENSIRLIVTGSELVIECSANDYKRIKGRGDKTSKIGIVTSYGVERGEDLHIIAMEEVAHCFGGNHDCGNYLEDGLPCILSYYTGMGHRPGEPYLYDFCERHKAELEIG